MRSAATPCGRPDCRGGYIMETGFCDTCYRRPTQQAPSVSSPSRRSPELPPQSTTPPAARLDSDGLLVLPFVPSPPPREVVSDTARPPIGGRRCGVGNCVGTIGVAHDGGSALDHGFCPRCGREYSFAPRLHPDDLVGGHYRVLGYLAVGGLGWVYLAEDTEVDDLHVVLKGLINTGGDEDRRLAVEESRSLTTLHHRDIVRIVTSVDHQAPGETETTRYIVMEYVGGRSLDWIIQHASDEEPARLYGETFEFGHVLTYGCKILGALDHLHGRGLLYCDMKPANVIHYEREIKIIDLGAVRRIDDRRSRRVFTAKYAPRRKERDERGFHIDTDLYTVAQTLKDLADRATPAVGLAARSFKALIRRATHLDPAARFTSAAEMSRQIWEVLREHLALSGHEPYPERSTRFEPTARVFGLALGTVPALDHWRRPSGPDVPELPVGVPDPQEAARALPVPIPDPTDAAAVLLGGLATDSPERIAERAAHDRKLHTAESALWLCRAYLNAGDTDGADRWVRRARQWSREHDWRLFWHSGLLYLMRSQVKEAHCEFSAAYAALPGEAAPKLALGYCAEYLGAEDRQTEEYYEAVWRRDRTQGSAAFGLVRTHLRRGDRREAVAILDQVPTTSRHHDAARVATIRVLSGWLPGAGPSTAAQLSEAAERLERLRETPTALHLDGSGVWDRLVTEVRGHAVACRPSGGWGPDFPTGELFGQTDTSRALSELLSESLKRLADQAGNAGERGDLLDRAYAVLPESVGFRDLLRRRRRTV